MYTDIPCPHLDAESGLCGVYERRREANRDCLSVADGIRRGVFPADCPYVADIPGYLPPIERPDSAFIGEAMATLAAEEIGFAAEEIEAQGLEDEMVEEARRLQSPNGRDTLACGGLSAILTTDPAEGES